MSAEPRTGGKWRPRYDARMAEAEVLKSRLATEQLPPCERDLISAEVARIAGDCRDTWRDFNTITNDGRRLRDLAPALRPRAVADVLAERIADAQRRCDAADVAYENNRSPTAREARADARGELKELDVLLGMVERGTDGEGRRLSFYHVPEQLRSLLDEHGAALADGRPPLLVAEARARELRKSIREAEARLRARLGGDDGD